MTNTPSSRPAADAADNKTLAEQAPGTEKVADQGADKAAEAVEASAPETPAAKKTSAKRTSAKRTTAKKTTTRKTAAKKPVAKQPSVKAAASSTPEGIDVVVPHPANIDGFGRIPVINVTPVIDNGTYPVKAVVDELVPIRANVFREGHDAVAASIILTSPEGEETRTDMVQLEPAGLDIWEGWVRPDSRGLWTFRVEGWSSPWKTWKHNALAKLPVSQDIELVCLEARELFKRSAKIAEEKGDKTAASVLTGASLMMLADRSVDELLETVNSKTINSAMDRYQPREMISPTKEFPMHVNRRRALFSAWYEFFPRSQGATYNQETDTWTSGNFRTSFERLDAVAAMGFDIVYLPPIHPIGTAFKKGKNNSLTSAPDDPGSPWAIGSPDGGHMDIHPDLGTIEDFDAFVEKANELGLEVALDFALQCSPDHPWVAEHPEWFTTRLDGTIAYAENPPKKYQDIYPINFDNDPEGIYAETYKILEYWINHGVTVFRVDNPHTKPLNFWDWLVNKIHEKYPDVLFLAEAFTKPAMMQSLGRIGYDLSYTYFTWRNTKYELAEYLNEVAHESAHRYRPSFWVNTPDINPMFVRSGLQSAFVIRTVLAATMSPSWGMYSGWELMEHIPLKEGGEEYLDSEKYEYKPRNFNAEPNLNILIGKMNGIRRDHPALQQLRQSYVQTTSNDDVFAFAKRDGDDRVIVVCSMVPERTVEANVSIDMESLGLPADSVLKVRDELTGKTYVWGTQNFVRLTPSNPAHVLTIVNK